MHTFIRMALIAAVIALCSNPAVMAAEVRLSAAASLSDALKDIAAVYAETSPEARILTNFGASGALARQIEQGAPADLYVSANARWIEHLVSAGRISAEDVRTLAGNALVFVGRAGLEVAGLADLPKLERIAIASPKSAPAGEYAEQAFKASGIDEQLAGRLILAQDVRQALVYADRGEVDGALVYKTDALLARQAVILYQVPAELHDDISYPMALTLSGRENPQAVAFFTFLQSDKARRILEEYGFILK